MNSGFGGRYLLVLLCVTTASATLAEPIERNFESAANPELRIENRKGSVKVIGWSESSIHITGDLADDDGRLEIDDDSERPEIRVISSNWRNASESHLVISVPAGTSLEIETASASIEVEGVSGASLRVETSSGSIDVAGAFARSEIEGVSGGIRLADASGDMNVSSVSGKVEVKGSPRSLRVETVSGEIELDVQAGNVELESVSGSIRINGSVADEIQAESVSGSINFSGMLGPEGEMELHALSGTVTVEFDEPVYGEYSLSTFSGSVNSDLDSVSNLQRSGKQMEFEYGEGECSIELESFSGSVSVR